MRSPSAGGPRLNISLARSPTLRRISRILTSPMSKRRTVSSYVPRDNHGPRPTCATPSLQLFRDFPSIDEIEPAFTLEEIQSKFKSLPPVPTSSNRKQTLCPDSSDGAVHLSSVRTLDQSSEFVDSRQVFEQSLSPGGSKKEVIHALDPPCPGSPCTPPVIRGGDVHKRRDEALKDIRRPISMLPTPVYEALVLSQFW